MKLGGVVLFGFGKPPNMPTFTHHRGSNPERVGNKRPQFDPHSRSKVPLPLIPVLLPHPYYLYPYGVP